MRYLTFTFILLLVAAKILGRPNGDAGTVIKGTVSFEKTPIVNATVLLQSCKDSSLEKGTITDSLGNFIFNNIKAGNYFISVQSTGYRSYTTKVFEVDSLHADLSVPPVFLDTATVKSLKGVVVKSKKPLIEKRMGRIDFNVENSVIAIGSTAWDVLRKAPNVKTNEQGFVSLRGNESAAVMINNKLVNLAGDDLVSFLRNINSEDIIRIELITNPSAKYDAEGTGGIVNIITRKNKEEGLNGTATAGYMQSAYSKYNAGLNLNYKHKNLSVSGNYGYRNGDYLTIEYLDQEFPNDSSTVFYNEALNRHRKQINNNYKLGINYVLNKKSTMGIQADGSFGSRHNNDISHTPIHTDDGSIDSTFLSHIFIDANNRYFSLNTNYRGEFDTLGKSLNVDIDYLKYYSNNRSFNINDYLDANNKMRPVSTFRSDVPQEIRIYTASIDYTHPVNESIWVELGAKANKTETDNNYTFENLIDGTYINDTTKSNHFIYEENIMALYSDITKTIHNTTIQLGVRGEYTKTKGNSLTLDNIVDRSYFKIFPTIYFQQKFSDNYQLELNYGKRIRRPSYSDMNPFRYYSTPYSYSEGNPFLQPEYTNSFELVHTFKNRYMVTFYYYSSKDEFLQIPEQNIEAKTIAFHRLNLNKSKSYGVSIEIPFEAGIWQSYNSADISRAQVSSNYLGSDFSYRKITANISSTQSFTFSKILSAEISASYRSPGISGLFHLGSYSEVALGIKRKLLKDKGILSVNFSDIFRGTILSASVNYLDQKSVAKTDNDLRSIRLNFQYRFGTSKNKPAKERSTSNKEERTRVGK
jgi:outer membrane receptor for ferrienterochelin and colicin